MGRFDSITCNGIKWVDIENPTRTEIDLLAQDYPFHPLNLEDCLSKRQLTKMDQHEEYLFVLLHFPVSVTEEGDVGSSQVSMFLGKNYLVTLHGGDFKSLAEIFQACKVNERQQVLMGKSSSYLLYRIIDRLVDEMVPILDKLMSDLDDIEDEVFDERVSTVREINRLRREIADLRRIISPLRRLIIDLSIKVEQFTGHNLSVYFSDIKDHVEKEWETLDGAKETIEIYKDADYILTSEKSNKILAVLTIIFTLTIPATTLGTLYGMNVNLPGGIQTGPWSFLGTYTTMWVILLVAAAPTSLMTWYFHRLGWI